VNTVVDSSVLVAALIDTGADGDWAEQILASGFPVGPEMVRTEATNVLRRLELSKALPRPEANAAFEDLMLLELELLPFDPFAQRVWELRHTVTSYDAWYVAIAEAYDLPLATLDERLSKASGPRCRFLLPPEIR
jgi:predicted nucleic acid-binding protein